jgi:hypothetical protein
MKRNMFGEAILQPDDDILATFMDELAVNDDESFTAFDIDDDPTFGWSCVIHAGDLGKEMQAHDFKSESDLRAWLTRQGVEIAS